MAEEHLTIGVLLILALLVILLSGLLGFWIGRATANDRCLIRELETELDNRMQELNRYKSSVNQHFDRTSNLFAGMAGAYRDLYHHLARSCSELADKPTLERLEDRAGRLLANVPLRDREERSTQTSTENGSVRSDSAASEPIHPPRPD